MYSGFTSALITRARVLRITKARRLNDDGTLFGTIAAARASDGDRAKIGRCPRASLIIFDVELPVFEVEVALFLSRELPGVYLLHETSAPHKVREQIPTERFNSPVPIE